MKYLAFIYAIIYIIAVIAQIFIPENNALSHIVDSYDVWTFLILLSIGHLSIALDDIKDILKEMDNIINVHYFMRSSDEEFNEFVSVNYEKYGERTDPIIEILEERRYRYGYSNQDPVLRNKRVAKQSADKYYTVAIKDTDLKLSLEDINILLDIENLKGGYTSDIGYQFTFRFKSEDSMKKLSCIEIEYSTFDIKLRYDEVDQFYNKIKTIMNKEKNTAK